MNKYQILGHYFDNSYHMPPTSGIACSGEFIKGVSPANTDLSLWEFPVDHKYIGPALASAEKGFITWRKVPLAERIQFLQRYKEEVQSSKNEIAEAIALETGKPLWESLTEAAAIIGKVDTTINDSLPRITTKEIENILPQTTGKIVFKPIGASLIIGPFNFPCHLANGQILSALIAGNSIIFKPSEKTAYSAQLLINCFKNANFPEGVINLVQGDGETARRLLKSKIIKGVFFTGSKEVGLKILRSTYEDLSKLVSLELGGKNTTILHHDCHIEHALAELIKACFLTAGQRCTSTAIVLIHRNILEEFLPRFHQLAKRIIVDHPIDSENEPFMGPLIDQRAVDNYLLFMSMAKREGIKEIMRGKVISKDFKGHYVSPSIHFSETFDKDSHFLTSEIFGPNCTFIPYDNIEEAIDMANSTQYGLAAAIFSKDKNITNQCVEDLEAGLVNINRSTVGASSKLPFGGIKNSGNYRPAAVATIDASVYQQATLEVDSEFSESIDTIKGLSQ